MIEVSAPGKIMIAGEWAVLEPGHPAVVAAVDRRARVRLGPSPDSDLHFDLPDFGIAGLRAGWTGGSIAWGRRISPREKKALRYLSSAVEAALGHAGTLRPFAFESSSGTFDVLRDGVRKKLGFGSSASVVVATVAALLGFHGVDIGADRERERVLKLSLLAHQRAQGGRGSGFDVAASTFGGILTYRRPDPAWLEKRLGTGPPSRETVDEPWPGLEIENLEPLPDLLLSAGWTGASASTPERIGRMDGWRSANAERFAEITDRIRHVVLGLIDAWKRGDGPAVLERVSENRALLRELGSVSRVDIESPPLRDLSDAAESAGGAGKPSGAGGADIGIALCLDPACRERVHRSWEEKGIVPIPVGISSTGYEVEAPDPESQIPTNPDPGSNSSR